MKIKSLLLYNCNGIKDIKTNAENVNSAEPEPEPPRAGVFGWSQSHHFGPAPAQAPP